MILGSQPCCRVAAPAKYYRSSNTQWVHKWYIAIFPSGIPGDWDGFSGLPGCVTDSRVKLLAMRMENRLPPLLTGLPLRRKQNFEGAPTKSPGASTKERASGRFSKAVLGPRSPRLRRGGHNQHSELRRAETQSVPSRRAPGRRPFFWSAGVCVSRSSVRFYTPLDIPSSSRENPLNGSILETGSPVSPLAFGVIFPN